MNTLRLLQRIPRAVSTPGFRTMCRVAVGDKVLVLSSGGLRWGSPCVPVRRHCVLYQRIAHLARSTSFPRQLWHLCGRLH